MSISGAAQWVVGVFVVGFVIWWVAQYVWLQGKKIKDGGKGGGEPGSK